jgi:serine/threonine protein kinase
MRDRRATTPPVLQALSGSGSGLDTTNGAAFVQQRIALFAKILTSITFVFLIASVAMTAALGRSLAAMFAEPTTIAHVSGMTLLAVVWLVARSGRHSVSVLGILDAGSTIACCTAWAMFVTDTIPDSIYWGVVAEILTILARAIIVPSSASRTLGISALALLPLMVRIGFWLQAIGHRSEAGALQPPLVTVIYQLIVISAAVFMATTTSRIIYELRRKVQEANEVGPYSLEERLGAGGMGEVWRARHRFLVRSAAVKLIRPEVLASGQIDAELLFRRFEREARVTASLRSPHTVQLYDFGQAEDGSLFYVMEMLAGIDLEKLVARHGPVPAERAIHILKQACHSLAEAHQNGLIHRDVKPANIFVSCFGTDTDFVKVLDFGLVGLARERTDLDRVNQVNLTQEGSIGGTPAYAAPEIVLGEAQYDHRVDIYAMGCVGYWLVTGKLVFEGDTPMKIMLDHARTPPPRPQTRTELPIPPELEQLILDCLEKDPSRRPESASVLATRLANIPVSQAWTAERAEKWWRTHLPTEIQERLTADVLLSREGAAQAPRKLQRKHS